LIEQRFLLTLPDQSHAKPPGVEATLAKLVELTKTISYRFATATARVRISCAIGVVEGLLKKDEPQECDLQANPFMEKVRAKLGNLIWTQSSGSTNPSSFVYGEAAVKKLCERVKANLEKKTLPTPKELDAINVFAFACKAEVKAMVMEVTTEAISIEPSLGKSVGAAAAKGIGKANSGASSSSKPPPKKKAKGAGKIGIVRDAADGMSSVFAKK